VRNQAVVFVDDRDSVFAAPAVPPPKTRASEKPAAAITAIARDQHEESDSDRVGSAGIPCRVVVYQMAAQISHPGSTVARFIRMASIERFRSGASRRFDVRAIHAGCVAQSVSGEFQEMRPAVRAMHMKFDHFGAEFATRAESTQRTCRCSRAKAPRPNPSATSHGQFTDPVIPLHHPGARGFSRRNFESRLRAGERDHSGGGAGATILP